MGSTHPKLNTELYKKVPISLRELGHGDLNQIKRLSDEVFPLDYPKGFFGEMIDDNSLCLGIFDDAGLHGFVFVMLDYQNKRHNLRFTLDEEEVSEKCENEVAYISSIAVRPSYQKRGLASFMLSYVNYLAQARPNPNKAIYLHVMANNKPAISLYKKMGFLKYKKVKNYYQNCVESPDAYIMVKCFLKTKMLQELNGEIKGDREVIGVSEEEGKKAPKLMSG